MQGAELWNYTAETLRFAPGKNDLALFTTARSSIRDAMLTRFVAGATVVLALAGCMTPNVSPPVDVSMVPNDCGNREFIIDWLTQQAALPRKHGESLENYEFHRRQIRAKIWHLRYICQPA